MTPMKHDKRELLRKLQMPLQIFFGLAPVPLLMGALITPDTWAMPLITAGVYLVWAWLLIFLPGALRVPFGVAGCIAVIATGVLTMPVFTSAAAVLLPAMYAALLFYSWQIGKWGPDEELNLAIPAVSIVAYVITQFLMTADSRLGEEAKFLQITTPLTVCFLAFLLLAILSMNRDNMQRAVNGGSRAPKKLRRRNIILSLCAMGVSVGVSALPAVIDFATRLRDAVWTIVGDAIMWLLEMMSNRESAPSDVETGSGSGGGLPVNLETSPLAAFLEKVALVLAVIGLIVLCFFGIKRLARELKKLFMYIAEKLRLYAQNASEDYEDEITDLRDETGARDNVLSQLRKRLSQPRVDEKALPPRERIRYLYKKLNRKHADWHQSATARENIPENPAKLYERARYSEHEVTVEDAERFRSGTKSL